MKGRIEASSLNGEIDIYKTLESGQTFQWEKENGEMYKNDVSDGWYTIAVPKEETHTNENEVIRVRQDGRGIEWDSSMDATSYIYEMLRLKDNLPAIFRTGPTEDEIVKNAYRENNGLRIVNDLEFPCLISFICSSQMSIPRIQEMQSKMRRKYGYSVNYNGDTYYTPPIPEKLSSAPVSELKDMKLGYRADYVSRTASMVADGKAHPCDCYGYDYIEARNMMKDFVGVGDKVADCALLFSLGYLTAVPIDTWIESAIEENFPDCRGESYNETSENIRSYFGKEYAGYFQQYIFSYLRDED